MCDKMAISAYILKIFIFYILKIFTFLIITNFKTDI